MMRLTMRWSAGLVALVACRPPADSLEPAAREAQPPAIEAADPTVQLELAPDRMVITPFYVPQAQFGLWAVGRSGARYPVSADRWTSSDPRIVPIDTLTGVFRPGQPGVASVTAHRGSRTITAPVTVHALCRLLVFIVGKGTLQIGERYQFTATVCNPEGATHTPVRWSSLDSTIAMVDATGGVTGRRAGTTDITASTNLASMSVGVTIVP